VRWFTQRILGWQGHALWCGDCEAIGIGFEDRGFLRALRAHQVCCSSLRHDHQKEVLCDVDNGLEAVEPRRYPRTPLTRGCATAPGFARFAFENRSGTSKLRDPSVAVGSLTVRQREPTTALECGESRRTDGRKLCLP